MPSFDTVSEYDEQEAVNAVDQANREVSTRFDFKGTESEFKLEGNLVTVKSESDFQCQQMLDILQNKLTKRGIDIGCLEIGDPIPSGKSVSQIVTMKSGLESDMSKKMVKLIKQQKMKVQAAIQGEKVRVTGKKRDDLQKVMALLKESKLGVPLQFENFRD